MTESQIKALIILKETDYDKPMKAGSFAYEMWPGAPMHSKRSNQGNGACAGKAAWLCGGSYLAKLEKKKLVRRGYNGIGYYITLEGKKLISEQNDAVSDTTKVS